MINRTQSKDLNEIKEKFNAREARYTKMETYAKGCEETIAYINITLRYLVI